MAIVYKKNIVVTRTREELINENRWTNVEGHDWYGIETSDFVMNLRKLGFINPIYSFNGFSSQGEGGSITTEGMNYMSLEELNALSFDIPTFETLRDNIISLYKELRTELQAEYIPEECFEAFIRTGTYRIDRTNSHYYHRNTTRITHGRYVEDYLTERFGGDVNLDELLEGFADSILSLIQDLGCELYNSLEGEYSYLTSDEGVWETLEANELYGFEAVCGDE